MKLFKSTIVIWSESDPSSFELSALAREAEQGEAYCAKLRTTLVENVEKDEDWDGTEFFGDLDDGAEEAEEADEEAVEDGPASHSTEPPAESAEPRACPRCGSTELHVAVETWAIVSEGDPTNRDRVDEHQCGRCAASFWC